MEVKAVIGVDGSTEARAALRYFSRLDFRAARATLVHAIDELPALRWDNPSPIIVSAVEGYLKNQEEEGRRILEAAAAEARSLSLNADTKLRSGSAANALMSAAQADGAGLIAVGCRNETALERLIVGSVVRKLMVSATQSLLIARGDPQPSGTLDAVFATDHSDYSRKCLESFVRLAPRGLRRLTVMTAYPPELLDALRGSQQVEQEELIRWAEEHLARRNQEACAALAPLGAELRSAVIAGAPGPAMDRCVKEQGAQLLVMGAQGHGFLERLVIGSNTFHQAVAGRFTTLLLRCP